MRTKNSIINILVTTIGQVFAILINLLNRRVFITVLGIELLGINGLFSNIFTLLSLAELGVGIAIVYSLYKPINDNDFIKIRGLLNYYKSIYVKVGVFIFIIGLLILPFLDFVIKDSAGIKNLNVIYLIFLINTTVSYLFSYKRSVLIADQKNYIIMIYHYTLFFLSSVIQIVVLLLFGNFLLYLVISILSRLLENLTITRYVNIKYPHLKNVKDSRLSILDRRMLNKNIKALAYHKFGAVIVNSTDNIVISKFVGLQWVGLYSNYVIITSALVTILSQVFGSVTASIGNLNITESNKKNMEVFNNIFLANFWIYGFSAITFYILSSDFISIWIGDQYLMANSIVFVLALNFFLNGTRKTTLIFKDAKGLFWADRYKPLAEGILNLVFSILLVQKIGFIGVFIGTILSNLLTTMWIEPYVLFKYGFQKSVIEYFTKYLKYFAITSIAFIITLYLVSFVEFNVYINLFIKLAVCIISINAVFALSMYRSNEFKHIKSLAQRVFNLLKGR